MQSFRHPSFVVKSICLERANVPFHLCIRHSSFVYCSDRSNSAVFSPFYPSSVIRHPSLQFLWEIWDIFINDKDPSSVIRHPSLTCRTYLIVLFLTKMFLTEISLTKMSLRKMSLSLCDQGPETKWSLPVFPFSILFTKMSLNKMSLTKMSLSLRFRAFFRHPSLVDPSSVVRHSFLIEKK